MKIRYLGTAAAEGAPALFCTCDHCAYARKAGGKEIRSRAGSILDDRLKIDFGPDSFMQMIQNRIDYTPLKSILVTHSHSDHFCASDIGYRKPGFANLPENYPPVTIYGNAKVGEAIESRLSDLIQFQLVEPYQPFEVEGYTQTAYLERRRFDYKPEDVKKFRDGVKKVITPACARLFEKQRERIGVDKLHWYDESLVFQNGNADPEGDRDALVQKALEMYRELSPETGEFFEFMVEYDLFDLETKPGKRAGGYCTSLPKWKAPFIFSNFNGTAADVGVLMHEAGHAFESFIASRRMPLPETSFSTSEINEIHSMSMEHFTYPWMDRFFGEKTNMYLYDHLWGALNVIPYMCCVDEFQHRVYDERLNAAERRAVWHELERKYMPWRDYDGNEFLSGGGFWMQKQHIFLYPFYYIEYALAQMCAFQFYLRMDEDRAAAWADYMNLCRAGGSRGYFELLKLANLDNPFSAETVESITNAVVKKIDEMEAKL